MLPGGEAQCRRVAEWIETVERLRALPELGPGSPELVQTHISVVLIGRERVLKLKKPVDFDFVDYSTLERRRVACEAEIRLNSRLAPDLYLGAVPVTLEGPLPSIGDHGEVFEYGVLMRRLPDERMLDRAVADDWVTEENIDEVAEVLWYFHQTARRDAEVRAYGAPAVVRAKWDDNFEQTVPFIGRTIEREDFDYLVEWLDGWMRQNAATLQRRADNGQVVEGHGDVRCESICLTDPITIFDCVEFNESFRCCDVANEIAFLAMDLAARGRADLGYVACDRYVARSRDDELFSLFPFFQCYLAFVRGKVLSFELGQAEIPAEAKQRALQRARTYFELARRYASPLPQRMVICTSGLSGTGKTSVARAIGHEFGIRVISADSVRHDLYGTGRLRDFEHNTGPYSPEANRRTYDAMLDRARAELERGGSVLLDATFRRASDRRAAAEMARSHGVDFALIECRTDPEQARSRLDLRAARGEGLSGATFVTYQHQLGELEAIDEIPKRAHLVVDTSGPRAVVAQRALEWLRARGPRS